MEKPYRFRAALLALVLLPCFRTAAGQNFALDFSSASAPATVAYDGWFEPGPFDYSIAAWVKAGAGDGTPQTLFSQYEGAAPTQGPGATSFLWLFLDGSGNLVFTQRNSMNQQSVVVASAPAAGEWFHVVAMRQSPNLRLLVNGQEVSSTYVPFGSVTAVDGDPEPFMIGAILEVNAVGATRQQFKGQIDEVAFFHRAVSTAEVEEAMVAGWDPGDPALRGYWRFDEGAGDVAQNAVAGPSPADRRDVTVPTTVAWSPAGWAAGVVPEVSIAGGSVDEGATIDLLLTLSDSAPGPVEVSIAAVGGSAEEGSDFTMPATVTFAAGSSEAAVSFAALADGEIEADETVTVRILSATGATIALAEADVTIVDATTPVAATVALRGTVAGLGLDRRTEGPLRSSLEATESALERGNTRAAEGQLRSFDNKVRAQAGKKIDEDDADALLAQSADIQEAISVGKDQPAPGDGKGRGKPANPGGRVAEVSALLGAEGADDRLGMQGVPDRVVLHGNYPNPFNPTTVIRFGLPERTSVRLAVYDLAGRVVRRLEAGLLEAGHHEVRFDAEGLPSGTYVYRLEAGGQPLHGRMMLVR